MKTTRPRLVHRKNLVLIGLTGGIACGKSTVRKYFEQLGAATIDTDAIARDILRADTPAGKAVIRRYGPGVVDPHGAIRRDSVAEIVFSNPRERKWLESVTHPAVTREINNRLNAIEKEGGGRMRRIVVIDMPLLYEAGFEREVRTVVVVSSGLRHQMGRIKKRNGMSAKEARARIDAQSSLKEKCARADHVILNDGLKKELKIKVKKLWQVLTNFVISV